MNAINGIIFFIFVLAVLAIILGLPVMLLWDWLMPTIFGLPTITFWQAVGINLLSGFLFRSSASSS